MKKTILSAVFVVSSMLLSTSAYAACGNAVSNSCSNGTCITSTCSGSTCSAASNSVKGATCTGSSCGSNAVKSVTCSGSSCSLTDSIKNCLSNGNCTLSSNNYVFEILSNNGNSDDIKTLLSNYTNSKNASTATSKTCTNCNNTSAANKNTNTATNANTSTKTNTNTSTNNTTTSTKTNNTTTSTKTNNTTTSTNNNTTSGSKDTTTTTTTTANSSSQSLSDYESQVLTLINAERAKYGLSALSIDSKVQSAAEVRANEITKSFSHTRPDGTTCFTALAQSGATYSKAAENIAYGQKSPQAVVDAWMNSEGHRANILTADFTKTGIGCVSVNGTLYWTQFFTK